MKGLGKLGEAEISYKRAILLEPSDADAFTNLGLLFEESGRIEEAEAVYDLMIKSKSEPVSSAKKPPIIALLPFGRSGSLFFHSLLDGHPEITTLPGYYFKGWFGMDLWQKFPPTFQGQTGRTSYNNSIE